ncbi:MAG: DUF995 domain-containing protein [Pseudomonadota bacterium]
MKLQRIALVATVLAAVVAAPVLADRKPSRSTPTDPAVVMDHYLGNTWNWSEGGSYWGSGGDFQAIWKGRSYGEGKWYVTTQGTLCYDAVWTGPNDDGEVGSEEFNLCWRHVTDRDGQVWQKHHEENDWYRLNPEKVSAGNVIAGEFKRIKSGLAR